MIIIACRYPILAFQHKTRKTKKGKSLIVFGDKNRFERDPNIDNWETLEIPCGQCIECRIKRSKDWSIRLMYELKHHNYAYFITLTYDDKHLPKNGSLQKKDMQDFIKRWRGNKESAYKAEELKYYYCGEYGSQDKTERPHYHMIAYLDNEIPDLKFWSYNNGNPLYKSKIMTEKWGKGWILIGEVTQESRQYVAGYVNKKILGKGAYIYDEKGILPPYTDCSNGISKLTPQELIKIYETDTVYVQGRTEIKKFKPPKNFDEQLEHLDEFWHQKIKEQRRESAIIDREAELAKTVLSPEKYRKVKAEIFDQKYKIGRNKIKNDT